jgi:hypothetical protein
MTTLEKALEEKAFYQNWYTEFDGILFQEMKNLQRAKRLLDSNIELLVRFRPRFLFTEDKELYVSHYFSIRPCLVYFYEMNKSLVQKMDKWIRALNQYLRSRNLDWMSAHKETLDDRLEYILSTAEVRISFVFKNTVSADCELIPLYKRVEDKNLVGYDLICKAAAKEMRGE